VPAAGELRLQESDEAGDDGQHAITRAAPTYADSGPLTAKLVKNGTLKTYHGYPHGMPTTHADVINADLLAWLQA
jgi:non-heme chloroperoxidase